MRDAPYSYITAGGWRLFPILLSFLLTPGPGAVAAPPRLLSDLDIPLMAGFREEADSRVVFDTPEGRIIEVRAHGPESPRAAYEYYRLALSGLSWRMISGGAAQKNMARDEDPPPCESRASLCIVAERDRERLTIKIRRVAGKSAGQGKAAVGLTIIDFLVAPL